MGQAHMHNITNQTSPYHLNSPHGLSQYYLTHYKAKPNSRYLCLIKIGINILNYRALQYPPRFMLSFSNCSLHHVFVGRYFIF
ncbi:hypothetical protein Hanom_Chr06g00519091 [Helianthus anomalus]